ncbi:MAG: SpoIIE family protein phosphatase [Mariprofundaceae bacterium]|nr:SpoIIE family protein phosphatase [Mariprofundaceae bacterium]
MPKGRHIRIQGESDVVLASIQGLKMAKASGMSHTNSHLCATVVSELATNIIRYAQAGEISLYLEDQALHIIAKDQGPGIADVTQAMQEGFSGGSGLGMGLSGVARMMDDMHIETSQGKGTQVFTRKSIHKSPAKTSKATSFISQKQHMFSDDSIRIRPYPGQSNIGDGALLLDIGEHRFLALWDVAGHGDEAAALSKQVSSFIRIHVHQDANQILQQLHQHFLGSRGLVAALGKLHLSSGHLAYAGVGNIAIMLQRQQDLRRLSVQEGVIGYQIRTPQLQHLHLTDHDSIILHSDGIHSLRQSLPINRQSSASQIASHIIEHHRAAQADDACCLVLRYKKQPTSEVDP